MVYYRYIGGKPHYYFNGVLKRFRESVDRNTTKDELVSVLQKIRFPIEHTIETVNGRKKVTGFYNSTLVEDWIRNRKQELVAKLEERRSYDIGKISSSIGKKRKPVYDDRDERQIREDDIEAVRKENEARKAAMRKRMEDEIARMASEEDGIPGEDMDTVSDELLKKDDVSYDG